MQRRKKAPIDSTNTAVISRKQITLPLAIKISIVRKPLKRPPHSSPGVLYFPVSHNQPGNVREKSIPSTCTFRSAHLHDLPAINSQLRIDGISQLSLYEAKIRAIALIMLDSSATGCFVVHRWTTAKTRAECEYYRYIQDERFFFAQARVRVESMRANGITTAELPSDMLQAEQVTEREKFQEGCTRHTTRVCRCWGGLMGRVSWEIGCRFTAGDYARVLRRGCYFDVV